jgi:ATP-dependent Clp protease ATP-binding subunit ClpA
MIVMTSNIGNTRFDTTGSIGFSEESAKMNEHGRIYAEIRKSFNPEFINRIDEIVYFESLDRGHIAKIIDLQIRELQNRLADRHIKLSVTDEVKAHLLEKGFSQESGARRIRRLIESEIEDEVALMMLSDKQPGSVCAVMSDGKISVRRESSPEKSRETAAAARSNEG